MVTNRQNVFHHFFIRQASSILLGGFCVKQQHFNTMQQWTSASLSQLPSEMPFWYSYPPKGVDKGGGIFAYMHLTTSHPPHSYKHVLPCTREGTFSTMWKYMQSAANSLTTDNYRRPPLLGSESGTKSIQVCKSVMWEGCSHEKITHKAHDSHYN